MKKPVLFIYLLIVHSPLLSSYYENSNNNNAFLIQLHNEAKKIDSNALKNLYLNFFVLYDQNSFLKPHSPNYNVLLHFFDFITTLQSDSVPTFNNNYSSSYSTSEARKDTSYITTKEFDTLVEVKNDSDLVRELINQYSKKHNDSPENYINNVRRRIAEFKSTLLKIDNGSNFFNYKFGILETIMENEVISPIPKEHNQ